MVARLLVICLAIALTISDESSHAAAPRLLDANLMVTWYGNPRCAAMGVLGRDKGRARAQALRRQAEGYAPLTAKRILPAYHLVAVVAQNSCGADRQWRRRETADEIDALLTEAREHGYHLVLDIQPGHSTVGQEVAALLPWLRQPDVHLALDPEFDMAPGETPGRQIGRMSAADINGAIETLESLIRNGPLPPKVLIVHQFRLDMLPDKSRIRQSPLVDVVLDMDGFGPPALKRASYRAVMREPLAYAGLKLFYEQDRDLLTPQEALAFAPVPSVVIYQ